MNEVNQSKHLVNQKVNISKPIVNHSNNETIYQCRFCNNKYKYKQSRWKHEKTCNKTQEQQKDDKLRLQLLKEEAKILKLKLKLQNSNKVDKITLKKLNSLLLERHNRIKNSTVNSNNNSNNNNNTINVQNITNYQLVGFGKEENIHHMLTNQEKQLIIGSRYKSLEKLIEIIHCGNYNQFKNVIVTNIKDNYMYKYDDKAGMFVLSNKKDVLNSLVDYRMGDLEILYNELLENNRIDERTKSCIERFINDINNTTDSFKNTDGTLHENYRQFKISEIKVLLFNHSDKMMSDVSLLLSTEETDNTPENIVIEEN